MQLTKRQSLFAALAILGVFFTLATAVVRRSRPAEVQTDGPVEPEPAAPAEAVLLQPAEGKSKVVLNEFHRSEVRDGRMLWEVSAKRGQYLPEKNSAELAEARLRFFRKTGEVVTLDAKRADLYFEGQTLAHADLSEGLALNFKREVKVVTENASYDRQSNSIKAPGRVKIKHALARIVGEDLSADISSGQVSLGRNVETVLKPRSAVNKRGR